MDNYNQSGNDYNGYGNNYNYVRPANNTFAILSSVFGAISIFLSSSLIIPLILGSIGAILAVLSKEDKLKMNGQAKAGFILSIAAVVSAIVMTASSVYMYFNNPSYHKQLNEAYEQIYGVTMDEYIQSIYDMYNEVD